MTTTLVAPLDAPYGRPTCPSWCDGYCQHIAGQARLIEAADMADPVFEIDVSAPDVKIDDLLCVDGEWLPVYSVLADAPSNNVQISVTEDPRGWSDLDQRDECPESFDLTDTVRVRRGAQALLPATGGTK